MLLPPFSIFSSNRKKNIFCPPLTMVTAVCSSFAVFDAKHESAKKKFEKIVSLLLLWICQA